MTEYIEREAALESVREKLLIAESLQDSIAKRGSIITLASINDSLKSIPAADVRPVVHGEWIGYPECLKYPNAYADDHIVCSVCEECFSILDNCTERFDFCPHCGADMREES